MTVSFDSQGGTSVNSQTVNSGNTVYEPVTTRDGYTFKCWSTSSNDSSCSKKYNFNTPVYSNKTLYAQWQVNKNVEYEYVKTTWDTDNVWVTQYKTGNNVKLVDTKTAQEKNTTSKTYTYRTVSWFRGNDSTWDYGLWLNNIPSNAENVRFSSQPARFTSNSELQKYQANRYSCVIQMTGHGCPNPYEDDIINAGDPNYGPGSFRFTHSGLQKIGNKYSIHFNLYNTNWHDSDYKYLAPIKFSVSWNEVTYTNVTKYKYAYKSTITKYSTSNNDKDLLNKGYVLTGRTR